MTQRSILLIGGNGFLGRHIAAAFDPDDTVSVLDNANRSSTEGGARKIFEGSVTDPETVRAVVDEVEADTIVLLASYGESGLGLLKSAELSPREAIDVNVRGLLNVLDAAAQRPNARVIWMSSTTVYGSARQYPTPSVNENDLLATRSIYAATKVLGEQLIRSYRSSAGLRAVALRPTLVWGPGITNTGIQAGLSELVEAAATGSPVSVAGSDEVWDLLYVRDAAAATAWLSASEFLDPVLLVNGYRASVRDVREALLALEPTARATVIDEGSPRLQLPAVDDSLIRQRGFVPRFDLESSIRDYLETVRQWLGEEK